MEQVSKRAALAASGIASAAFVLVFSLGSYKASYNFAVYTLFGAAMFLGLWLLTRDGLLSSRRRLAIAIAVVLGAFAVRMCYIDARSGDYNSFLQHWAEFFRENGGLRAIGEPIGDYNLPYLYLLALISYLPFDDLHMIKLMSVVCDVLLAFYAMRLTTTITESDKAPLASFLVVLCLPTVFLNSSWWAQCDSIYATFALAALYYGLKHRPVLAVLMGALSFAFKLQAIFILPIFAVLLMRGDIKWRHVPLFPAFYALLVLPAVIAGRPPLDALLIYAHQTGEYSSHITLNAPTLGTVFKQMEDTSGASAFMIVLAFVYLAALLLVAWNRRKSLDDRGILLMALAMAVGIPFLLPSMHERYFYLAEILSVVCAAGGLMSFVIPTLVQAASMICYDAYITGYYRLRLGLATFLMACGAALIVIALLRYSPEQSDPVRRR